jgi:hypothetical protein
VTLPVDGWQFRVDPDDQGLEQKWYAADFDAAGPTIRVEADDGDRFKFSRPRDVLSAILFPLPVVREGVRMRALRAIEPGATGRRT